MLGAKFVEDFEVRLIRTDTIACIDARSMESEHPEVLRFVPDLVDVGATFTGVKPLLVGHLRFVAVERSDVIKLEGVLGRVFDVLRVLLQIHRMGLVNFGHELGDIQGCELHQLLHGGQDIFVACAQEFLMGHASFLQDAVESL